MTDTHTTSHIPDDAVQAALLSMAQDNIGADVQGLLMHGFDKLNAKPNALRNALAAALPHLSAPCAVEERKLGWERTPAGNYKANSEFGTYTVIPDSWTESRKAHLKIDGIEKETEHSSIIEAKAAAQADFERRILSCVVTKPVDVAALLNSAALIVEGRCTAFNNEFIQKLSKRNVYEIAALVADHDIKLGAAIRTLSAEPAQGDQWQDISTAEERAFDVILRVPDPTRAKGYKEVIGHWAQDLSGEEQPPFRGWFTDAGFGFREVYPAPTHWRRLPPAAPNSEAGK